jgi:hypothetical protein
MAKKFDIANAKNGEHIPCPYCGSKGVLASRLQGEFLITHKYGWIDRKSSATGKMIRCEALLDGCLGGRKVGFNFEQQEEELTLGEEELCL